MKRLANKTIRIAAILPADLHERLVRQMAKETADRGRPIGFSQIIRWAIEDYLDMWEKAEFVPDKKE